MNPSKTAVSNAYMDANGIGKVITISEAVFQALPQNTSDISCDSLENIRGGCPAQGMFSRDLRNIGSLRVR